MGNAVKLTASHLIEAETPLLRKAAAKAGGPGEAGGCPRPGGLGFAGSAVSPTARMMPA